MDVPRLGSKQQPNEILFRKLEGPIDTDSTYYSMIFSKIKLMKVFSQLDIVVTLSYWYAEFEVFWCKNLVTRIFQSLGHVALAVARWLKFSTYIPLSFCTKTPQIRHINSWLLYLAVKKISAILFLKKIMLMWRATMQ